MLLVEGDHDEHPGGGAVFCGGEVDEHLAEYLLEAVSCGVESPDDHYEAGARNPISVRTTLTRPSRNVSMSMPRTAGLPAGPKRQGMAAVSELV